MTIEICPNGVMCTTPGHTGWIGQLYNADRTCLYETVLETKPKQIFEVGTWLGGGSTFFLAKGLQKNGFGQLHTSETDAAAHGQAIKNYQREFPELLPFVKFYLGNSLQVFSPVLYDGLHPRSIKPEDQIVDILFLDGADNAEETVAEFMMFEPFFHPGSIFMAHDWLDRADAQKMRLLRPIVENSKDWKILKVIGPPESVGFVKAVRI
jgi:predicted O-methyltransferase YrrM